MVAAENSTLIVLHTTNYVIIGRVALVPGARLTDFIRESDDFIAIVDAVLYDRDEVELKQLAFLDVRKDSIEIIYPAP